MNNTTTPQDQIEQYLSSGWESTQNPFITEKTRIWGKHSGLIASLLSLVLLIASYIVSLYSTNVSNAMLVIVYFFVGPQALIDTIKILKTFRLNIEVLMTLAAFLSILIGSQAEGALLLVLFAISHALEDMVTQKTKGALSTLQKISPSMALVIGENGQANPKSVKEITPGTKILIKAGEVIPLDGKVLTGSSYVNLSHITGESVPVEKKPGDPVQAGGLNTDGSITVEVTKTSAESTLAKIIELITQAQSAKPKLQRFLDKFGSIYATSIIGISFLIAIFMPLLFLVPYLGNEGSIYRSLAFLIACSPCALIIGAPTAYLGAISACARKGILLKGGVILDALSTCKKLFFDKTGTLTTGNLYCSSIDVLFPTYEKNQLLAVAAGLENGAHHPIADAIVKYVQKQNISLHPIDDLKVIPGEGVSGKVKLANTSCLAFIGSLNFILSKVSKEKQTKIQEKVNLEGNVVAVCLIDDNILIFHFVDELRKDAKNIVEKLSSSIDVEMLTGDHEDNAKITAHKLNLKKFHSGINPKQKLEIIQKHGETSPIIMVGDGINDAPALTYAHVGIAMGKIGSYTAIEASDVVLLNDDISSISWLLSHAKKTYRIVKQNIYFALFAIVLNAVLSLGGYIPLFVAVILHEGSTVLVGLNSLRLLKKSKTD